MDERRHENTMSDELLDRELTALLSVGPSPDFMARVRMHVDSRISQPTRWLGVAWIAITAATAITVVAVVVGTRTWLSTVNDETRAFPATVQTSPDHPSDVIVSPSELRAVQRLLIAARGKSVARRAGASGVETPLLPPMPIVIQSLDLPPLVTADLDGEGVQ
ncbi:MAG: hypothetical protein DMF88_07150 [Acidobacteria bacterium]|nr:MAG: hypothetical protein DMF88_07150 [Acidobacteriota bacterium]